MLSVLTAVVALTAFQPPEPKGVAAIVESLVSGLDMAPPERTAGIPDDADRVLAVFRQRERLYEPAIEQPFTLDGPEGSLYFKRVRFARVIFALFDRADSMRLAEDFVAQAALSYEWESMASGPLAEAESADLFLAKDGNSPIAPYVQLFAGHRRLCAISGLEGLDPTSQRAQEIGREADRQLVAARGSGYPLIRIAADYLLATRACYLR